MYSLLNKFQERWCFRIVLLDIIVALVGLLFDTETLRNKIYALLLIASTLPVMLLEGDATAMVFMAMIAVPTFFAKENWIYQKERSDCGSYTPKGDVQWLVPNRKTPIAYSTKAASDLIVLLAEEGGTIIEVQNKITYDAEAKAVLQAYIDRGYGNVEARKWFKY